MVNVDFCIVMDNNCSALAGSDVVLPQWSAPAHR